MSAPDARRRGDRRWFGHGRTRALLSAGALLGAGAVTTSAYFTDRATVTGVTVDSGALHIDLPGFNQVRGETYAWSGLDLSNMAAGTTRVQVIRVSNHSRGPVGFTFDVRAAVSPNAAGTLGAVLQLRVTRGSSFTGTTCDGTQIGSSNLSGFVAPAGVTVASGGFQDLCFQVTRPSSPTTVTGSPASVTFTFPAKQVAP